MGDLVLGSYTGESDRSGLTLLRLGRLAKILRALRLFGQVRILWELVSGLLNTMNTICSFTFFLFVIFYIFACFGVEVITKYGDWSMDSQAIVDEHFSSLPVVM